MSDLETSTAEPSEEQNTEAGASSNEAPVARAEATRPGAKSTLFSQWVSPLVLIVAGLGFSIYVRMNASSGTRLGLLPVWFALYSLPLVAFFCLVGFRLMAGKVGRASDLVITWVVAFLVGVHTLHLMVGVGILGSLQTAIPLAAAVLYVGFGVTLAGLEFNSPLGLRVRSTIGSQEVWRKTHRLLGIMFGVAALIAPIGAIRPGPVSLVFLGLGPAIALAVSGSYARRLQQLRAEGASESVDGIEPVGGQAPEGEPDERPDEQKAVSVRPSPEADDLGP